MKLIKVRYENILAIEIDDTVKPVQLPKRRVPVATMKPFKEELQDLQKRGIIAPVERNMNWISSMVVVQKPSSRLRVCIDPKPLNKALKHSHFPLPTIDGILPDLSKAKVFKVCDVKSGFSHVKLEEESSFLTTFSSPFGRYHWLRMPMGDVDVVYVPGPEMWPADTLSRAYLPESAPTGSVEAELETINMAQHLPISEDRLSLIRSATKEDKTLQTLIKTI